jgi:hypothetical protein
MKRMEASLTRTVEPSASNVAVAPFTLQQLLQASQFEE